MPPSWTRDDLFLAFRHAKSSLFFEARGVGLVDLARFEQNLGQRLDSLHEALCGNDGWFQDLPVGTVWVVPKKLRLKQRGTSRTRVIRAGHDASKSPTQIEVQVRLSPSPECAIVEVLFLWRFGPILDNLLSENSVGRRLSLDKHQIRKTQPTLFEYWRPRYNAFRTAPIRSAQEELRRNGSVLVISADLTSFYDSIDPQFLLSDEFLTCLQESKYDVNVNSIDIPDYVCAVRSLLKLYSRFRTIASRATGVRISKGVPIGSLTGHLVANLSLVTLDRAIESRGNTLCYRRYVDDMVIVAQVTSRPVAKLKTALLRHIPHLEYQSKLLRFRENELDRPGSSFEIKREKCRAYLLSGKHGAAFLSSVRSDIVRLTSESRAFVSPELVTAGRLPNLIKVSPDGAPLTVLRDADRPRLEHWKLANRLRSLERMVTLLDRKDAQILVRRAIKESVAFLEHDLDWVENIDRILRILQLGLRTHDWDGVRDLLLYMERTWVGPSNSPAAKWRLYYRGRRIERPSVVSRLARYLDERRLESTCRAIQLAPTGSVPPWFLQGIGRGSTQLGVRTLFGRAALLAAADLRVLDREDDSLEGHDSRSAKTGFAGEAGGEVQRLLSRVADFLEICQSPDDRAWKIPAERLFLSTRPPSYTDIARRVLRNEEDGCRGEVFDDLNGLVNAIRGTRYWTPIAEVKSGPSLDVAGAAKPDLWRSDPRLILGNLVLKEDYYRAAAGGRRSTGQDGAIKDLRRLCGLSDVLAGAHKIAVRHQEERSLLVLPELGLPRAWFRMLARHVSNDARFGVVTGLEYLHDATGTVVSNEVYAVLPTVRKSALVWRWTKRVPAREEEEQLRKFGLSLSPAPAVFAPRMVLNTRYGRFCVLICSELIEARRVADLLGRVEIVGVPAWNKDTASYDHLIQSVGLQLNAVIAVANNGTYSDCRVWAPRTVRWQRDMCRLISRHSDDVVGVTVRLAALRRYREDYVSDWEPEWEWKQRSPDWRPLPPDWP